MAVGAMAARMLQRRFISIFTRQTHHPVIQGMSPTSLFCRFISIIWISSKGVTTNTNPIKPVREDVENSEADTLKLSPNPDNLATSVSVNDTSSVQFSAKSSLKTSSRHDLAMIFTCKVCETRSIKTVCRESYEKGVVVARCGGCNNLHLIADHLGWFGEPGSVEDFLATRGEEVKRGSIDTLNLTLEDLAGRKP
ncbi:hypothetical protein ACSQ67_014331 [Phaseolus vulgaris]